MLSFFPSSSADLETNLLLIKSVCNLDEIFEYLDKCYEKREEMVIKCKCSFFRFLIEADASYLQKYLDLFESP